MSEINFFSEETGFVLRGKRKFRSWIIETVKQNKREVENINFIFCSDNYLYKLNIDFLDHDTLTDVITFEYNEKDEDIMSDIYISIDRVKENAKLNSVKFYDELARVIIHGVLHLLGYKDKTDSQKLLMRSKEDYYLSLLS